MTLNASYLWLIFLSNELCYHAGTRPSIASPQTLQHLFTAQST